MTAPALHIAIDVVELWVADLRRTARILTGSFGFAVQQCVTAARPNEESACLTSGHVTVVLRQCASQASSIARHVARHGDDIADVALVCNDVEAIVDRARARGLATAIDGDCARIDVTGHGTITHSVRDRSLAPEREPNAGPGVPAMRAIDHVTYCLPWGTIAGVADVYRDVFGLTDVEIPDCAEIGDSASGMRSLVLRAPEGFSVVLVEPLHPAGSGQTERFLHAHGGPGLQHLAIAYDDLPAAAGALRANGVSFLAVSDVHLDAARRRLAAHALPWDTLQRQGILVDDDGHGLLYQLFTRPFTERGTFFFELIQRAGATGFGAGNVRALFAAVDASMHSHGAEVSK